MEGNKKNKQKLNKKNNGYLLILGCSQKKKVSESLTPAIYLYDGVNFRVLKKILSEQGWPPSLQIKILSAKYGLIDATTLIEPYDLRFNKQTAEKINKKILTSLKKLKEPSSIFVNLGKDYLPAIKGFEDTFPNSNVTYANGPIGKKMQHMKQWLEAISFQTASVPGRSSKKSSYLYFFPDWDDYIYEPFNTNKEIYFKGTRKYAHEICGDQTPFDGILLSLSHLHVGKGPLHRFSNEVGQNISLRKLLHVPKNILLFGDCGAFSYVGELKPPFTPEQAAKLYDKFDLDIGASVDHIPLSTIPVQQPNGSIKKVKLSKTTRYQRMYLTRTNAEKFIKTCKEHQYKFIPLGVIQGIGKRSYVERLHDYLDMGYKHIALGGLVPRTDKNILDIVCAIRQGLQTRTREYSENVWLHLFGILRPKLQPIFKELGVSSFDSASYFRKAWLRSNQNYLASDGRHWYGTIRIPISTTKAMQISARKEGISKKTLAEMEQNCLNAIEICNKRSDAKELVTENINLYGPLLNRKGEENHFSEKHAKLLEDRPWEKCSCPFCRDAGIHVVVFRGASRNKRRGFHNTWVFYHKMLHKNRRSRTLKNINS